MFLRFILLSIYILAFTIQSCSSKPTKEDAIIEVEIKSLTSDELKTAYLEKIYLQDQKDRDGSVSDEIMYKNDLSRLARIESYLKAYGHPKRNELGGPSADVTYLVLHHIGTVNQKKTYFPTLYKAMLDKDLPPETIAFFLGRFQKQVNGTWINFDRPFTTQEEIDTLVQVLGMSEIVSSIKREP